MSDEEQRDVPFTLALIAGGCAGTAVDVALYPLDTLRTRLQSPDGFWKAGGFSRIYTGVVATALGAAPGAAFFFSAYEGMKPVLKRMNGGQEHPIQHSCAASCGEVAACLVRVPTAVVTQRMQVGQYASFNEAVVKIAAENGVMTFYTGYWTTVAREIPFSFIQFPMYEGLKKFWRMAQGSDTTAAQGAACGSLAGAISSAVTTPLDVAKTRMMIGAKTAGGQLYSELGGTPLAHFSRAILRATLRNSLTPRTPALGRLGHAQGDCGGGGRRRPLQGHRPARRLDHARRLRLLRRVREVDGAAVEERCVGRQAVGEVSGGGGRISMYFASRRATRTRGTRTHTFPSAPRWAAPRLHDPFASG